jgi:hypothetical protein
MNVLRVAPYPIVVSFDVPSPSVEYTVKMIDSVDGTTSTVAITSGVDSKLEYSFALDELRFDREFEVLIYENGTDLIIEDHISIVRPYVDPTKVATGATEIAEYKKYEFLARAMIDGIVTDGFYNKKTLLTAEGEGIDIFPVWSKTNKVLKVYENNVLMYDSASLTNDQVFSLMDDASAIQRFEVDEYNRSQSAPINLFAASGNLAYSASRGGVFAKGSDYTFILDSGYKSIPSDIELATLLLIDDLKCGRLDYYKKFITEYDAVDFKITFDRGALVDTGNNIVDKILKKYKRDIFRPGVL